MNAPFPLVTNPEFGSPAFWELYDQLCSEEGLAKLVSDMDFPLAKQMGEIAIAAHRTRAIHTLSRPERGWEHHHAWLALRHASIQNHEGNVVTNMSPGDVIIVQHGWDRDVPVTHLPLNENIVSGYFLSGRWEPMIGLFLPLFSAETIARAIELRMAQSVKETREFFLSQVKIWGWYP